MQLMTFKQAERGHVMGGGGGGTQRHMKTNMSLGILECTDLGWGYCCIGEEEKNV